LFRCSTARQGWPILSLAKNGLDIKITTLRHGRNQSNSNMHHGGAETRRAAKVQANTSTTEDAENTEETKIKKLTVASRRRAEAAEK